MTATEPQQPQQQVYSPNPAHQKLSESPHAHARRPSEFEGRRRSGLDRRPSSRVTVPNPTPLFLVSPTPDSVAAVLDRANTSTSSRKVDIEPTMVLRHTLRWAVDRADVDLVGWLAGLGGRWASILDQQVAELEDEDGWGVVGIAIQSSCGHSEKEECVRLIIGRWGVNAGPREGRDRQNGWTPLHLAALLSSPQIVSVLLNRGASPHAITDTGLSPFDLVGNMEGREDIALLLDPLHAAPATPTTPQLGLGTSSVSGTSSRSHSRVQSVGLTVAEQAPDMGSGSGSRTQRILPDRRRLVERRRLRIAAKTERLERKAQRQHVAAERERWVRERAKHIGVDPAVLYPTDAKHKHAKATDEDDEEEDLLENGLHDDELMEEEMEMKHDLVNVDDSMLVFSLHQLPAIYDIFITNFQPVCQPLERRSLPANALYLYARFSHYCCDETWLEELLECAVERIERGVYSHGENLAFLAFWDYNLTLLLYLLRADPGLHQKCHELNILPMMEELINAIHVFIIRIAERKIDDILDAAMLDFESLEDFEGVRFEDEWNLFRSFGSKKKSATPLAAAMFVPNSPEANILNSPNRRKDLNKSAHRPTSMSDLRAQATAATNEAKEVIANGLAQAQARFGDKVNPRKISDILTSVLLILQLYDVNPAFIVQIFSQTFYWISSELFNRIITRKRYLCRTKAVQIRMNITVLEDWTRSNGLPPNIASRHLRPVMQLLQWLQCLSQINEFDMLIGTVQSFRQLNPLQMRRAVRDYRYEVDEGRMANDCMQYLAQLQRDWERRRTITAVKALQSQRADGGDDAEEGNSIDALFEENIAIGQWTPQSAPECLGELLDSRFMLPFLVPEETWHLIATPPIDAAFCNLMTEKPLLPDGSIRSRPLSVSSVSSSKPLGWATPGDRAVRRLPEDFFGWLKERQSELQQSWDVTRQRAEAAEVAHHRNSLLAPLKTSALPPLPEDTEATPVNKPERQRTVRAASPPLPPLPPSDPKTPIRQIMISQAPRDSPDPASPAQSFEMRLRRTVDTAMADSPNVVGPHSPNTPHTAHPPHYELARHRRERHSSSSSLSSGNSGGVGEAPGTSPVTSLSGGPPPGGSAHSPEKKAWWRIGRKNSDTPTSSPSDYRRRREGTEETIVPGRED